MVGHSSWLIILTLGVSLYSSPNLKAGVGTTKSFVSRGLPNNNLRLQVSTHWVNSLDYRPAVFEFTCQPASPTQRQVSVVLSKSNWRSKKTVIQFDVEIPEGATRVVKTISVPRLGPWTAWDLAVFEDEEPIQGLRGAIDFASAVDQGYHDPDAPKILLIDRHAPNPAKRKKRIAELQIQRREGGTASEQLIDFQVFQRWTSYRYPPYNQPQTQVHLHQGHEQNQINRRADDWLLSSVEETPNIEYMPPRDLPKRWTSYAPIDVIVTELDELLLLTREHVEVAKALRSYVTAGGNLILVGLGDKYERLKELEFWLDDHSKGRAGEIVWKSPEMNAFHKVRNFLPNPPSHNYVPPRTIFRMASYGLGKIVVTQNQDVFERLDHVSWIIESLGDTRLSWSYRMQGGRRTSGYDFWSYLIPGVSVAPVTTFVVIITCFLVLIGPVNYWFLKKVKRPYLMLVTVPAAAGFVTLALLGYALVTEGLSVQVRLRSLTEINASTGEAISWSRQAYYAALAPSDGMMFPLSAVITPLYPNYNRGSRARSDKLLELTDQQKLSKGYLSSRSISQFIVVNSKPTERHIAIEETNGVTAINRLGVEVEHLFVCQDDKIFWGEQLGVDKALALTEISHEQAQHRWKEWYASSQPKAQVVSGGWLDRYVMRTEQNPVNSILEKNLRAIQSMPLSSGSYVAATRIAPDTVPKGVADAKQVSGCHVVRGRW